MFAYGSLSDMARATVTPSFVRTCFPPLSSIITFLPLGPRVVVTALASVSTPFRRRWRASSPKMTSFSTCSCLLPCILHTINDTQHICYRKMLKVSVDEELPFVEQHMR